MKAVGYPRVSTHAQDNKGYSLDDQVQAIESFCKQQGIDLVAHFMEVESAETVRDRPSFKAALRYLYNDPSVEAIVINNLDRYSRSVMDDEIIKRGLAKRGKRLLSVQELYLTPIAEIDPEHEEYLYSARQHRMVEAEAERKRIKRRVLNGKEGKMVAGGWIGFRPPYEYDVFQGELVINPERARWTRHMRRLRKYLGWTFKRIAIYMNQIEVPPPHARPMVRKRMTPKVKGVGAWTLSSVRNILRTDRDWSDRKGILKDEFRSRRRKAV